MSKPFIQNAFHVGELAPALYGRTDLAKYHSAAALAENFFVDYRGGLSSRMGTRYVIQAYRSDHNVRIIPFQASASLGYILEFGELYIRFHRNGAPVVEAPTNITSITAANPPLITDAGHGYSSGQWILIENVGGMTELNGNYYSITVVGPNTYTLQDLHGNNIDASSYHPYTAGGTASRVYTIVSPYAAADLSTLKYAQNVDEMIICSPAYVPYQLTFISETNWTISPFVFGTSASPPASVVSDTTLGAGSVTYAYLVTSVDASGQESVPSGATILGFHTDLRTTPGSNRVTWSSVANAAYYNIYKAELSYFVEGVPAGAAFGFVGFAAGTTFIDSNIAQDFSQTPPVAQNPFSGAGVASYTVTVNGTYTSVPTVTVAPSGGATSATANAVLWVTGTPTVGAGGAGYAANDTITLGNGVTVVVNTVAAGAVATLKAISVAPSNHGQIFSGSTPANPVAQVSTSGGGAGATINLVWGVGQVVPVSSGSGYTSPPAVSFSSGAAAATAVLGVAADLNPSVPGFFQQRLVLAGLAGEPQTFFLSQPGAPNNFNISNPIQADDAISGALVAGQLNSIKSMVALQTGMLFLTDRAAWLVSGGSTTDGSTVTPANISANPHAYNGASDVPPIVANYDILYVQAKGSIVRDLAYNIYANIYTGTDISVLSSHLFYGFEVLEWAWAEEPFKLVWAIRDDGVLLTLTYLKEQELIGWCHSTTEGSFKSVAVNIETTDFGSIDVPYFVVERVSGGFTVKFIERLAERIFPNGAEDAWCVDAGIAYDGAPATHFSGAQHLAGQTCTGLADGLVITPFVMPNDGNFTLSPAASKVIIGLPFTPRFQSLYLDVPDEGGTVQGREKKIPGVTVRVEDTLGPSIGTTFDQLVPMDDLTLGKVGSDTNEVVTNLVTGDTYQIIDPLWSVPGQYCIEQPNPWPCTILAVIPDVSIGDTQGGERRR